MDLMTRVRSQWDRLLAGLTGAAGVVVLIVGWLGVSGTAYPAEQLPFIISGGIGGLFLLGVSSALWLSADLHDEWRKLDRIEQAIRESAHARDDTAVERLTDVGAGAPVDGMAEVPAERTDHLPAAVRGAS